MASREPFTDGQRFRIAAIITSVFASPFIYTLITTQSADAERWIWVGIFMVVGTFVGALGDGTD